MKTLLLIISLVAIQQVLRAQDPQKDTILLADETVLIWGKTDAKIHCCNESVFNDLYKSHGTLFKRYSCIWKKDRHGNYKDYLIYVNRQDAQLIISWAKTNL